MIGPASRVARSIDVLPSEEISLHVHLLDFQLALLDALVHPLVAGIKAPHMAAHGGDAGLLGDFHQVFRVLDAVGNRDFDQHRLAGAHRLLALAEMHLGRRGQDHRVGALDALGQFAGEMRDAVFLGDLRRRILIAADQRGDLDIGDALERVEMLLPERALPRDADLHRLPLLRTADLARAAARLYLAAAGLRLPALVRFSRMMWPTAVFDAGTV